MQMSDRPTKNLLTDRQISIRRRLRLLRRTHLGSSTSARAHDLRHRPAVPGANAQAIYDEIVQHIEEAFGELLVLADEFDDAEMLVNRCGRCNRMATSTISLPGWNGSWKAVRGDLLPMAFRDRRLPSREPRWVASVPSRHQTSASGPWWQLVDTSAAARDS
jgi:hypothetical protein